MNKGSGDDRTEGRNGTGEALLLAPLGTLSRGLRWALLLSATALVVGWSLFHNGDFLVAWGLPDVKFYQNIAKGRMDLVPAPFSARPLAPLLARAIASLSHRTIEAGFVVLATLSLTWSVGVVFWLLLRSAAPRWTLLMVAAVSFWPQLLGFAGLPDPLYTALLAGLLLALESGWMYLAAALMLPLMLARESTTLTLACLLLVGWKRLGWRGGALAIGCTALGAVIVRHLSAGSLPNPEHLGGGLYLVGKLFANSLRSVGVQPWSNVYPELCEVPAWQMPLHLGAVRSLGVCSWTPVPLMQMTWVLCTTFGVMPLLALMTWRRWVPVLRTGDLTLRFCLLYGGISFLLAPALGTWYVRLFGYGWPLIVVGVPRLLAMDPQWATVKFVSGLLALQALLWGLGNRVGTPRALEAAVVLEVCAVALLLVHRQTRMKPSFPGPSDTPAW